MLYESVSSFGKEVICSGLFIGLKSGNCQSGVWFIRPGVSNLQLAGWTQPTEPFYLACKIATSAVARWWADSFEWWVEAGMAGLQGPVHCRLSWLFLAPHSWNIANHCTRPQHCAKMPEWKVLLQRQWYNPSVMQSFQISEVTTF